MTPKAKRRKGRAVATGPDAELPYRSLVERVPAIVYVDPAGPEPTSPTYVSPFIEQLLGYSPEVATGDPRVVGEDAPSRRSGARAGGVDRQRRDRRTVHR